MAGATTTFRTKVVAPRRATAESPWIKGTLISILLLFFGFFLILPLYVVFHEAFSKGAGVFFKTFQDRATAHAIWLTLLTAAVRNPNSLHMVRPSGPVVLISHYASSAVVRRTMGARNSMLFWMPSRPPIIGSSCSMLSTPSKPSARRALTKPRHHNAS